MAGVKALLLAAIAIFAMASGCYGAAKGRPFSVLKNILSVSDNTNGTTLKAGEDNITVTWGPSSGDLTGTEDYKTVKVKLCYAPESQLDRPWRKTVADNLKKDKTCQFALVKDAPYTASNTTKSVQIKKDVPGATYFVRAYVYDSTGKEVAYGQTTNANKTTSHFHIVGITGRTTSIDIASGVFSAFSILSLVYFFYAEKRKGNRASQQSS